MTTIDSLELANTENVFKPVAISMPDKIKEMGNETFKPTTKYKSANKIFNGESNYFKIPAEETFTSNPTKKEVGLQNSNYSALHTIMSKLKIQNNLNEREQNRIKHFTEKTPSFFQDTREHYSNKNILTGSKVSSVPPLTTPPFTLRTTTPTPIITTSHVNTLTTDPLFKHYKQPLRPVKGPFYLIIQGHSKVKTYGAIKNTMNRPLITNEIRYDSE